ncbi:MAG: cation:proton antiporter [Candidatus Pacearchaeota archaeon]
MVTEFLSQFMGNIPENLAILFEIGIMLIIAAVFAFLVRLFKQPLIPAYIIAGILIGPLFLGLVENQELIMSLSEIGVAFLIFTAGLEISIKRLKEVGGTAVLGGILQVVLLFTAGFFVSVWLGFAGRIPLYIGLVVAFSSTMIVFKLLADKRELNSLHGRIIIGILLVQDIAAIIALSLLTSDFTLVSILIALGKAIIFIVIAAILSKAVNPIFRRAAKSQELLLLVSISFLFLFSIGALLADLSLIIGAFFAGVALANSNFKTEIEGEISPIRNFFAIIFFVALGMQLQLISREYLNLLLILIGLIIIFKPLIIMFLIRLIGYKKRTAFFTGNALAQTSEFSLIIAMLGFSLGHLSQALLSVLILITIVTMSLTTYFIVYERKLYNWFSWPLNLLNGRGNKKEELEFFKKDGKRVILLGCHRMGSLFLKEFLRKKEEVIVVDYNPEIIRALINKKIPCIYGDFVNKEVHDKINISNAEMIISTIPDMEDNLLLIKKVRVHNKRVPIFVSARRISEALKLYEAGADYVIIPEVISGQKAFDIIKRTKIQKSSLKEMKKEHIQFLNSIHRILY